MRIILLALCCFEGLWAAASSPLICASGGAIGTIDLRVASPSRKADQMLPIRTITRLEEGDIVHYKPILRPHEQRKGDVTMVLVTADKKAAGKDKFLIFPPQPAGRAEQWKVPWRTAMVAFVYGPTGLSVKKVESLLVKDDELIGELADYADKTSKTEALITALTASDNSPEAVSAALHGFSSTGGSALAKGSPFDAQSMAVISTMNPKMANYDPLAGQGTQPVGQTAGLATTVGEMFFGTPVGLAAGGTALLMNLQAIAFPRTEFRSVFSQSMPEDALGLCGKTGAPQVHTRIAYLWAVRIPNTAPPELTVGKANSLPAGLKSPLPLNGSEKYLDHARDWVLTPDKGKPIPVKVQVLANVNSIELALDKNVKPGRYGVSARWDWDDFQVKGTFEVRPLSDFAKVKLTTAAQERLITGAGKVPLTLEGADFEFLTKIQMKKLNDKFAAPVAVPFILPKGLREDEQDSVDIQLDTSDLAPGPYHLELSQVDGKAHDVSLLVLPPPPEVANLPLTINQGVSVASFHLKGKRLDLLEHLELTKGTALLGPCSADGTERTVTVKLTPGIEAGTTLAFRAAVLNRGDSITIADGVHILPPRPEIASASFSQFPAQTVDLKPGELPNGLTLSAILRVTNLMPGSGLRLSCEQTPAGAITLQPGESQRDALLEQLTPGELFVTFSTAGWMNGCVLEASVAGSAGDSTPHRIGRIVDVPSIEQFNLADDNTVTLTGSHLEAIAEASWTPDQGAQVDQLPQPLSADGRRQKLDLKLAPPPAPNAILYVWLRGETRSRPTTVRAN